MARSPQSNSHFAPQSGESHNHDSAEERLVRRISLLALAIASMASLCLLWSAQASAGPVSTRIARAPGEIVPIPAAVPHEEGDMVDRRIVPDLRWIAAHFPILVTDGYSGPLPDGEHVGCDNCHVRDSDHYNGLAVDVVPLHGDGKCDSTWDGITRLAEWAEPLQGQPVPPFRWVGYDGDAGHGCGNHLHLSWEHAPAAQFQLAEWVEVFPTGEGSGQPRQPRDKRSHTPPPPAAAGVNPPAGPAGGISTARPGGVSARGD